ncbi:MAG: Ku protein [Geminicoccaceae bacterium]|uniref:non-homologous end joining protein Ku n=1 Tax=Reyranella sp. TaxID=1929291 RepID=UPI003D106387
MAKSRTKALKPTWEGHLKLSLVTCPVVLYTAIERTADVHFNLINPKTGNRIRMQTVDAGTGRAVERGDLVRGFAVAKNRYLLVDKDELEAVKLESTRVIDIESFVAARDIDRIYWDEPYYLAPAGKTGIEAFAVIRAAMAELDQVALGRLVLHQRERLCALEPRDGGILLTTLRSYDEIRDSGAVLDRHLPKPDRQMLEIAEKIVEQQKAKFDPTTFEDRYEDALRDLIARKKKGEELVTSAEPEEGDKVVDLMEALSRSLRGDGSIRRDKAERFAATRHRAGPAPRRRKRRTSARAA